MRRFVRKALGAARFESLYAQWTENSRTKLAEGQALSFFYVLIATCLALLPVAGYVLRERSYVSFDIVSILMGLSALSAVIVRRRMGLTFGVSSSFRNALSTTHTAFALGCIPLVILIIVAPEKFFGLSLHRGEVVRESTQEAAQQFSLLLVLGIATWAGLTEELIFRGMLLPTLRRWRVLIDARHRDLISVFLSSAIFAAVHIPLWGYHLSLALFGIGCGFGVASIALGELLLPLIVYHIIFDFIALCVSAWI